MKKTILAVIITAIVVGGGVYMWQNYEVIPSQESITEDSSERSITVEKVEDKQTVDILSNDGTVTKFTPSEDDWNEDNGCLYYNDVCYVESSNPAHNGSFVPEGVDFFANEGAAKEADEYFKDVIKEDMDNITKPATKEEIENFDTYIDLEGSIKESVTFPPGGCTVYKKYLAMLESGEINQDAKYDESMKGVDWEKYVDLNEQLVNGDIKKKFFYQDMGMSLSLYLTPRYDFNESNAQEMNKCIEGVGYLTLYKVFDDYILWGDTQCTGGAVMTEDQKPGITKAIAECEKVSEQLIQYVR
ncbi:hypothetical protein JW758_06050 [Candidatus Peregrinibacteria bacterium]|nr:hypothetical protein [Candidatus Peregrinibacteria bacterium]